MSYQINFGEKDKGKPTFSLDYPSIIAMPMHLAIGIGDKKKRYKTYLEDSFNYHPDLLNRLVIIHEAAKEHGGVNLVSKSQFKDIQLQCVKEFLEANKEILSSLAPYVIELLNKPGKPMPITVPDLSC